MLETRRLHASVTRSLLFAATLVATSFFARTSRVLMTCVAVAMAWSFAPAVTHAQDAPVFPGDTPVDPEPAQEEPEVSAIATALAQEEFDVPESTEAWSDAVWDAAIRGDAEQLEAMLAMVPADALSEQAVSIRAQVEAFKLHAAQAATDRSADREDAHKRMVELMGEEKYVRALTAAVELQTLSDDWSEMLVGKSVQDLIAQGDVGQKLSRDEGDWLLAQDLLYRLRTLHEDAGELESYKRYDDALDEVNRRIGLLAQFAPRRLHELRRVEMERFAPEEEFPEYNDAFANDWKELLADVNERVLLAALSKAAQDHISGAGWKPLLLGGLEALRIFVTTDALGENFPSFSNAKLVERFDSFLEINQRRIRDMPKDAITRGTCRRLLGDLLIANDRTLQLDKAALVRQFGDGAMYRLEKQFEDEYSQVIWPDAMRRFQQQVNGAFVGVGILIRHDDRRRIMIVNPLEGSPAARAGIKAGDVIVGVNGVPTVGWSLNRAVDEITGPIGGEVMLKLDREGEEEPIELAVSRDQIKMRSVNGWWKRSIDEAGEPDWDWYIDEDSGIGYVRLTSFNEDSFADFIKALTQMQQERELKGLILDLRHNPGGLLRSAVEFSNLFVESGRIVSGEDRSKKQVWELTAQPGRAVLKELPTVVLVNQGSASASEIVAGALQAHDSAVVLGERTYGKGSVQTVHDLSSPFGADDPAAVKLTTQYYVLPTSEKFGSTDADSAHGRYVHKKPGSDDWGVNPHVEVPMTPEQIQGAIKRRLEADLIAEWLAEADREPRPEVKALVEEGLDPQLEKALILLKARTLKDVQRAALLEK